jgi:hypothetical protein
MTPAVFSPQLLVPRCLHGDLASTRAAWDNLFRRAWEANSWQPVFAGLDVVPVDSLPGRILLHDLGHVTAVAEPHWRLHWVKESWQSARTAMLRPVPQEVALKKRDLIVAGMREPWFVLGMWKVRFGDISIVDQDPNYLDTFVRSLLREYVYRIPELLSLMPRLAFADGDLCLYEEEPEPDSWFVLWKTLFSFLLLFGRPPQQFEEVRARIATEYGRDVVAFLLQEGIIEPENGRYRLVI